MLIKIVTFVIISLTTSYCEVSELDNFIGPFRGMRRYIARNIEAELKSESNMNYLRQHNKLQPTFDTTIKCPCDLQGTRSDVRPTSVHKLRPGDIDVIGALGDSLSAGFGAFASKIILLPLENRGASFIMGGDATWQQSFTIANIFKTFNPNLIGYSTGNSLSIDRRSKFNVAEGGAISDNLPYMASILVKRILNDPDVDVNNDWKFVNVMIGHNDYCTEICYSHDPEKVFEKHRQDMVSALRVLRDGLPRTLVNVIPPFHPQVFNAIQNKPRICEVTHPFLCPCSFGVVPQNRLEDYNKFFLRWQEQDRELSNMEEFMKDNFTVVFQPFTINTTLPTVNGEPDLSYLSADCFHLSQKGYATFAASIWNSLLVPVGLKTNEFNINLLDLNCPNPVQPYICTNFNCDAESLE